MFKRVHLHSFEGELNISLFCVALKNIHDGLDSLIGIKHLFIDFEGILFYHFEVKHVMGLATK